MHNSDQPVINQLIPYQSTMFNDRDLAILGAGALMAVLCLLIPLPFVGKVVLGFSVLVGFMFIALLRLGPDRIPFETWLWRRIRFRFQARRYTYQRSIPPPTPQPAPNSSATAPSEKPHSPRPITPILAFALPFRFAFEEIGFTPLFTAFLTVVGVDFLVWLGQSGAAEIAQWFH